MKAGRTKDVHSQEEHGEKEKQKEIERPAGSPRADGPAKSLPAKLQQRTKRRLSLSDLFAKKEMVMPAVNPFVNSTLSLTFYEYVKVIDASIQKFVSVTI